MKAVIRGLRYDTETADCLGEDNATCGKSDFRWFDAGLYRTPRGRFFVAGKGGPLTPFASYWGNSSSYGERIIPMTKEEALDWAEEHLTAEEVLSIFAEEIEDA